MPDCTRTFVAIAIPERLGRTLTACQQRLAPDAPSFRWPSTAPFHATLAFLGDVKNSDLGRLCDSVAAGVGGVEPIEVALQGLGAFPTPQRPRVIWAGLTAALPALNRLAELQKSVVKAVTHIGYRPVDEERFHPHVTLGRIKSRGARTADLTAVLERHSASLNGTFTVAEVLTFSSTLGPAGPSYAVLGRAPLKCEKAQPPS
jgi:2'-5' RNA ligase